MKASSSFNDSEHVAYAHVSEGVQTFVAPVDSKAFQLVIRRRYYRRYRSSPIDYLMQLCDLHHSSRVLFEGEEHDVQPQHCAAPLLPSTSNSSYVMRALSVEVLP